MTDTKQSLPTKMCGYNGCCDKQCSAQGEVNASDCIFSLDDIGKLTADDVIRAALSKYTDKNGVTDNGEGVVLTQESLDAINRMTERNITAHVHRQVRNHC